MRSNSEERSRKFYQRRIEALTKLGQYIAMNGPKEFPALVMEYDILWNRLYNWKKNGLLLTTLTDRKTILLHGINWPVANQYTPPQQIYRDNQLNKIARLTAKYGMISLRQLSSKTNIRVSTLRYWRNVEILSCKTVGTGAVKRVFITGVNGK